MGSVLGTASPEGKLSRMDIETLPPARASIVVEAVLSEKKGDATTDTKKDGTDSVASTAILSKEQLLKIQIRLPDIEGLVEAGEAGEAGPGTHLVLVVDKSGSMSGNPWVQVQASVKDIIGRSITQTSLKTDLIIYADNAHLVEFTPSNYVKVIDDLKAGGMTNFKAAFTKVNRVVTEAGADYSKTVIVFMTDGADTVNPKDMLPRMPGKLAERWGEINKDVVIHTVGFTSDHDFKFLKNLSETGGTAAGMFRYCEPSDDKQALKYKLDELFDFILDLGGDKIDISLTMEGDENNFLGIDKQSRMTTVQGKMITSSEATNNVDMMITAEAWIQLLDPYNMPDMSITVNPVLALVESRTEVTIPCIIEKTDFIILDSPDDKANWRLRILSRNVDMFIDKVGKAISENGDVSSFQEKIEKYQKQISHTRVFGNGITRERRLEMFEVIQDIQKNLDQVQNMLAQYVRGGTQSISLLARAHDMRYQAVFSKSRRQRIMDKRASKNMQQASSAQESLSSLIVDKQEVNQLSQDATDFYFCMLSQDSIQDVLLGEDKENAIGFGLAVKRNEVVLDEPTMIQIWVISGTLVSRTAMLDALEHKINVSSQLSAHGGFDFAHTELGVTTVGTSREPINAWLPLYVTKSHWDRVKVILKPALGSFCTLDPLGYDYKQMDVMFMTLGSMIGRLRKGEVSEHQLKLLFALLRTCAACLKDFEMTEKVVEFVDNFVKSPAGRTKDVIPNLFTLIGYIVAMPTEQTRQILGVGGDTDCKLSKLWLAVISECLRRSAGSLYRDASSNTINGLIDALLHGPGQGLLAGNQNVAQPTVCRATAEIARLCLSSDDEVTVAVFDPAAGVTVPQIELCHSQKVDRAMEIWAAREAGYEKSTCKAKSKQATDAKKAVKLWVKEGCEALGIENVPVNQSEKSSVAGAKSSPDKDRVKASTSSADDVKASKCTTDDVKASTSTTDDVKASKSTADDVKASTSTTDDVKASKSTTDDVKASTSTTDDVKASKCTTDDVKASTSTTDDVKASKSTADDVKASTSTADETEVISDSENEDGATDEGSSFNPQHVTASMLQILAQIHYRLCKAAYPSIQSLPGCIAFVNTWLSKNRNMSDIDNNSGIAPEEWIQETKEAVARIYADMEDFTKLQSAEESRNNVVKATEVQGCSDLENTQIVIEGQDQQDRNQDIENPEVLIVPDQGTEDNIQASLNNVVKDDDDLVSSGDDDDSDDYFEEYLDDDSEDEIAVEARMKLKKKQKKAANGARITVPMILHCIDSDLDITLMLRGMVCQAVYFHSNSSARNAITAGRFVDLGVGPSCACITLRSCHQALQDYRDTVRKGLLDKALWKRANYCMVHASTVWAFIGYLMNIHKERGEGFNDLLELFVTSAQTGTVPCLEKKVHVLLTGKYKDCVVFANGNQWLPEKKMATLFKNLLGEEKWMEFEVELRSAVQIHVYRESDIPNRHGHCNSNPYIPNALRLKLGMALLPEPKGREKGKRAYLKNSKTS